MQKDKALQLLDDIDLDIQKVRDIFDDFSDDMEVVGMIAMNISRRSSVYEPQKNKSETLISLLCDLSKSKDMGSRWAVAKNHLTPPDILEELANDSINLVRALVATNPNTPSHILNNLFSDEKIVRDGLSGNPCTPVKLLRVLSSDIDKMVRLRVVENPSTPKEVLNIMLNDEQKDVATAAKIKLEEAL
ncbi:MAG: hypothetical protein JXQ68_03540 [Campylobacterales bacterium]|nr:hypothetical protein [Campylobacterales bacterium]